MRRARGLAAQSRLVRDAGLAPFSIAGDEMAGKRPNARRTRWRADPLIAVPALLAGLVALVFGLQVAVAALPLWPEDAPSRGGARYLLFAVALGLALGLASLAGAAGALLRRGLSRGNRERGTGRHRKGAPEQAWRDDH